MINQKLPTIQQQLKIISNPFLRALYLAQRSGSQVKDGLRHIVIIKKTTPKKSRIRF